MSERLSERSRKSLRKNRKWLRMRLGKEAEKVVDACIMKEFKKES